MKGSDEEVIFVPIKGVQSGSDVQRSVPHQMQENPSEVTGIKSHFPLDGTIKDDDYSYFARRNAIANAGLMKLSADVFDKWFKVKTDNEVLKKEVEDHNKKVKLKPNLKILFNMVYSWGWSLLSLGYSETGNPQLNQEPTNVKDIEYITPVPKTIIDDVKFGENPNDIETYGEPIEYTMTRRENGSPKRVHIHAKRFLHWKRNNIWNTFEGQSWFEPMFNSLVTFENLLYSIGMSAWRNASPIYQLELPEYFWDYTPEDQATVYANANNYFKNLSAKSNVVTYPEYKVHIHATNSGMPLKDPIDFVTNTLSAVGVNRYMLEGLPAGAITGSEVNRDEYYLYVANIQRSDVEEYIWRYYEDQFKHGTLSSLDFELEWIPIKELTRKELAEIMGIEVMNELRKAMTIKTYIEAGYQVPIIEGQFTIIDQEMNVLEPSQVQQQFLLAPATDKIVTVKAGTDRLTQAEYEKKFGIGGLDRTQYERRLQKGIQPAWSLWEEAWIKSFEKIYDANINKGQDSEVDVMNGLVTLDIENEEFRKALEREFKNQYERGGQESNDILSASNIVAPEVIFDPSDKEAIKWLENKSNIQYTNTKNDMSKKIKQGLTVLLDKGLRVTTDAEIEKFKNDLSKEISKAFDGYEGNLKTMIRTQTQDVVIRSRFDSYVQNRFNKFDVLVSPDADEECQALLAGNPYSEVDARTLLPVHPNCTCDLVPVIPGLEGI